MLKLPELIIITGPPALKSNNVVWNGRMVTLQNLIALGATDALMDLNSLTCMALMHMQKALQRLDGMFFGRAQTPWFRVISG